MNLLKYLKDNGCGGTRTFRENHIPKDCPLNSPAKMKKPRETFELAYSQKNGIIIARWMDNSVVTVASLVAALQNSNGFDQMQSLIRFPFIVLRKKYFQTF